jgi:hypothetical protein
MLSRMVLSRARLLGTGCPQITGPYGVTMELRETLRSLERALIAESQRTRRKTRREHERGVTVGDGGRCESAFLGANTEEGGSSSSWLRRQRRSQSRGISDVTGQGRRRLSGLNPS